MEEHKEEYIEIDFVRIIDTLRRRAWAIVLAALLCGSVGFSLAYFVLPPEYQSSALLYVNNSSFSVGSTSISLSDLSASKTLVDTYIAILESRLTLNEVIQQAGVDYAPAQLSKMIKAKAVNGTELFRITVTSKDPAEAELIANTIVNVLPEKISHIINGSSVRTVDLAVAPKNPSGPSITKFTLVGLLCGFAISCGVIVVLDLLDEQIHNESYLLQTYKLPVLAAVPDLLSSQSSGSYGSYYAAKREADGP